MDKVLIRGFLVDVYGDRGAGVVTFVDNLQNIYNLLDVELIDVTERQIGKFTYDIVCDDEGLFKQDALPSAFNGKQEAQLVGNLLLVNHDEEGNFASLTDEQIEDLKEHLCVAMCSMSGDKTRVYTVLKEVEYA